MLFTSISFLYYFLPSLIIIYFITPKKYKNIILLIASLFFYLYGEPKYVFFNDCRNYYCLYRRYFN